MISGKEEGTWELTPSELEEVLARCHSCGDPCYIMSRYVCEGDDPMLVCGTCGANVGLSTISNLPEDWADAASRDDLHFAVKEEALQLTDGDDINLSQLGETLLDIVDSGGDDAAGLARARNQLAADPRFGAEAGIVRAIDALMESL